MSNRTFDKCELLLCTFSDKNDCGMYIIGHFLVACYLENLVFLMFGSAMISLHFAVHV